jgi:general secretion pathway protein E
MGELPASAGTDSTRDATRIGDAVTIVDDVLRRGIQHGASDIHFEPTAAALVVKFRLDGVLSVVDRFPGDLAGRVVARLKVLAGLLTYRTDIPQEGRIDANPNAGRGVTEQRVSIFPTIHGQRAVVRLFYDQADLADLSQLGLPDHILEALRRIAFGNQGVLLLTGPAGSGKSTTLAATLKHIVDHCPGKSIVALEDPVERHMAGVTQVQITPHGEMTFPTALRSLLRQDPQVLMIGEIRDAETARIAVQAGLTGHLLMSTLHSGTPAAALLRLLEMGIEPYQVTSSVVAVANQRLVRRLCPQCRRQDGPAGPFAPSGCPACLGTGFRGRALIAEMVQLDGALRKAILAKADLEELQRILAARGHMGLRHAGMQLVAAGTTTRAELDSVCPEGRE